MVVDFFAGSITLMAVFLFGALGEIITEKAGHLNLGTPGVMCVGAAGGMLTLQLYAWACGGSDGTNGVVCVLLAILGSLIFGSIAGLIYSFFCVTLKSNQNVVGLCLTTLGVGIFTLISTNVKSDPSFSLVAIARRDFVCIFPSSWIQATGDFGKIVLNHGFLTYLSIILAIVVGIIMRKTNIGLSIKAVGENPATADAVGINVNRVKYVTTIIGSAVAALGGLVFAMEKTVATPEALELEAFGWIAVALVIASLWVSELGILSSFLFAMLYMVPSAFNLGGGGAESQIFKAIPYVITLILLIVTSLLNKRELQGPAGLGITYFREDR